MAHASAPPGPGRHLFGGDVAAYDRGRPDYPDAVYRTLETQCGLGRGLDVLEVGPGNGLATRRLLAAGRDRVTGVEPDERFAAALRALAGRHVPRFALHLSTLERAPLAPASFDLAIAATSFHWVDADAGLARIAQVLRPGGWVALFWNVFGDPEREDPFHEATDALLNPDGPIDTTLVPFALDREARLADFARAGAFEEISDACTRWTLTLDPQGVRDLYTTFPTVSQRPPEERVALLDGLERIAREEFGGVVERNLCTPLYVAKRTA